MTTLDCSPELGVEEQGIKFLILKGNILITGTTEIIEVTPERKIVWRLRMIVKIEKKGDAARKGFYKAERIVPH